MKNYSCPDCQATINFDDINIAKDVAFCRSCGNTNSFSVVASIVSAPSNYDMQKMPKHVKVTSEFMKGAQIKYSRISPAVIFLIPFTCAWSGMSMFGIYIKPIMDTGKLPEISSMLFGLPFLIGSIVLISIILYMLFGKTLITLDKGKGEVFIGIGPLGWCRRFKYNAHSQVRIIPTNTRVNNVTRNGINISTDGEDTTFGAMIDERTKPYIAAKLKELIRTGI